MWQPLRHQQAPHVTSSAKQHLMPHWTHLLLVYDQHTAAMQTGACIQCMQLPPRQRLAGSTAIHGHQLESLEALLSTSLGNQPLPQMSRQVQSNDFARESSSRSYGLLATGHNSKQIRSAVLPVGAMDGPSLQHTNKPAAQANRQLDTHHQLQGTTNTPTVAKHSRAG
jgi:hypothetical protein